MGLLGRLFGKRRDVGVKRCGVPFKNIKPELLVIGLGNPGEKYGGTRHNIGFEVVNELYAGFGDDVSPSTECCEAICGAAFHGAERRSILLVKPLTYMNLSGDAVGGLMRKYGLTPDKCFVIVDDFNIPLGKIRFRKDGSHGGHNGLKSISAVIGDGYPRLRVGIGPLPKGISIIDFVLGKFCEQELDEVREVVSKSTEAVRYMIENGIEATMNRYN